jgi:hypothetical protein
LFPIGSRSLPHFNWQYDDRQLDQKMRPLDELMLMKVPECRCGISSMAAVGPSILNAACGTAADVHGDRRRMTRPSRRDEIPFN